MSRSFQRLGPPDSLKEKLLAEQENRCIYCGNEFGSIVWRAGRPNQRLQLQWDHMLPWTRERSSEEKNWAASCGVCNGLKSSLVFDSIDDAREYIAWKWEVKRIKVPTKEEQRLLPSFAR